MAESAQGPLVGAPAGQIPATEPPGLPPNLLLIISDTLRRDHVGGLSTAR